MNKMTKGPLIVVMLVGCLLFSGCMPSYNEELHKDFSSYWHQGKAELTRYVLEQARYGQVHHGDAVLVFVTEDILKDKQVKYEHGRSTKAINVLKLNLMRYFTTGIYPYSMMTSVFTPVDYKRNKRTLKVSTSVQEWCGHTYMQINYRKGSYVVKSHSYFQNEADQNYNLRPVLLEDEVWTRIRLDPSELPVGLIRIIPGSQYARLRHLPLNVQKAEARLESLEDPALSEKPLLQYTIAYQDLERKLTIMFEKEFPYSILAWEESTLSGFGKEAKQLSTRAVKTHSLFIDYWNKNSISDLHYREKLGLD